MSRLTDERVKEIRGFGKRGVLGTEPRDVVALCDEVIAARKPCEWSRIEPDCDVFNTCKEGEEFHLTEGLDLWPHCPWCGRKVEVIATE